MTALLSDRPVTLDAVHPTHRRVTAYVTGGLDGVLRVVTMLRGRGYKVRDLSVEVCDGVVESAVSCTVALTAAEAALLVERLRRMPAVVSADEA
ncbi:hypothetical protein [Pseudonocardia sp.]|jgi:hypothetical protein|uniref:hypothetical protein n=1 Tax=Pseudonocardia sp. TaxID=60912 RepID=UPI003D0A7DE5